jgi:XTP/dITP diphosphohydrolase
MDVRFVSSNPGKFREVREVLGQFGIAVSWSRRELPEPQADDLASVVRAKLGAIPRGPRRVLVEDSGLFIPSLGGFPGVYSAYVYRTIGLPGLLRLLQHRSRAARFVTVAGVREGGRAWLVEGVSRGSIAPRVVGRGGFGYDPIFVPEGESRTFAQMVPEEKNRFSHRGRALRRVGRRLVRDLG